MFTTVGKHGNDKINAVIEAIIPELNNRGLSGEIYLGYPIFFDPISNIEVRIDALIVSYSGVIILNYLENAPLDYTDLQNRLYTKVQAKLQNYDFLIKKRKLFFETNQITYSEIPVSPVDDYPIAFSKEELIELISKLLCDDFTDVQYSNILSGFQEAYGISKRSQRPNIVTGTKSELVSNMEKIVERYDRYQMEAILTDPIGIQRIRGMAGSGKTVILARKAVELHTKHPEWDIVITFNTRSLKKQLESLVEKFYSIKNNGSKPDYKKLRIINAWGSSRNPGLYYDICMRLESEYYTFSAAKHAFGKRDTFEKVCRNLIESERLPQKLYDCILVDEAQDFGTDFFKMCLGVLGTEKRLVYAYDELQNINEQTMKAPEELFGCSINNDTPLITTYRNQSSVIVTAHAIGMGLYSETGLIQIPSAPDVWESIGYVSDTAVQPGNEVTLYRNKEASPDFLETDVSSLISVIECEDADQQRAVLADKIKDDLTKQHLIGMDLMIIDMDAIEHELNRSRLWNYLEENALTDLFSVHLAGASSPEDFFRPESDPPSIVYSSINRAKGNEAYQVYIVNAQKCINTLSSMRERNSLFTAITRSKGWVTILGHGFGMDKLRAEIEAVQAEEYTLHFSQYPTEDEIKDIVRNNQDIAKKDQTVLDDAKKVIAEISKSKDSADVKLKLAMELFGVSSYRELMEMLNRDNSQ